MFSEEWKKTREQWIRFLKEMGRRNWLVLFTIVFVYGIRLVSEDISIDTEIMLSYQQEVLDSWIGIGRFGLVLTKKLFGFSRLVPFTENLMMMAALAFSGVFLAFAFWCWSGESRSFRAFCTLFPSLFLTGPCFAEQFHFTLQAFPVAFAIGLTALSVFLIEKWAWEGRGVLCLAAGVLLGVWAAGTYQVFAAMEVALFAMAFFLRITESGEKRSWILLGGKEAAAFACTMAAYAAVSAGMKWMTGCSSAYVEGQFRWKDGIRLCLHYIMNDVDRVLRSREIFYHPWTSAVLIVFLAAGGIRILKGKGGWQKTACGIFSLFMTAASPFYLTAATGYYQPARAQLVYPLALAFWGSYLTAWEMVRDWKKTVRLLHTAAGLACAVMILNQAQVTTGLFRTAAEVSRQDLLLLNRIYARVEERADREDMDQVMILLVGKHDPVLSEDSLVGDTIGYSFFNWEDDILGVTGRIFTENGLGRVLGLEYGPVNTESYENAEEQAKGRPAWPAQDSVWEVSEGVMAVKLGEK